MELTDVRVYTLQVPLANELGDARASASERYWVVVELDTDTGHTGTGWMGTWRVPELFERYTRSFADLLVGRDPFATESLREAMRDRTLYYPGEIGFSAHPRSAIDIACWDLKAQAAGRPLFSLLGGEEREIPAYCSRLDAGYDIDTLVAAHAEAGADGFTAVKTKVGGRPLSADVERVRALREALGSEVALLVDANQAWTVAKAVQAMDALAAFDVGWVEEPVSEFDVAGYSRVAARAAAPIASGEMFYRLDRLKQLLSAGAVDVAQHDLLRGGGVTGQWDAARLADAHDVPFAPHIYYELSAHLVSAAPTGRFVEYIPEYDVSPVLSNAPEVSDGCVRLPTDPGHGYRIDPAARSEYRVEFE